jgi:hypothetical protein
MMCDRFLKRLRELRVCASALLLVFAAGSFVAAQQKVGPEPNKGGTATAVSKTPATAGSQARGKSQWSVRMSKDSPRTFTVKAKDAPLGEITGEFAKLLKIPFSLSPVMAKQRVTVDFSAMNLEAAMRLLAPHPYIDYVAGGEDSMEAKPLAVYLHALNERAPSLTATVKGASEAMLIEGNTEDGTDGEVVEKRKEDEAPLKVTFAGSYLSVRAKKQPLTIVLFKVASEVGVPFEMRYDTTEVIDVDFSNYSLDQAVRTLSPFVRFYYRADLQTFEIQPLRIALVAPASGRS